MTLRLIFMGTPDFAVPTLETIAKRGHDVAAVYTRAPRPAGRGMALQASPVEQAAGRLGLPVLTPKTLRTSEAQERFQAHAADAAVVVAYGLILPKPTILDGTRLGCFNLHASLLPRWRGAAPLNRAVMAGDAETGVMVMRMDEGLDTGPVARVSRLTIEPDMTAGEVHDALAPIGAELMGDALAELEQGALELKPQPTDGVTYASKITNEETRIDWGMPCKQVHDHVRGLSPFPGAWCELPDGARAKILRTTKATGSGAPGTVLDDKLTVACAEGAVRILVLQRAGKQAMKAEDFLRGSPIAPGAKLR